jgi:hypothetical protein
MASETEQKLYQARPPPQLRVYSNRGAAGQPLKFCVDDTKNAQIAVFVETDEYKTLKRMFNLDFESRFISRSTKYHSNDPETSVGNEGIAIFWDNRYLELLNSVVMLTESANATGVVCTFFHKTMWEEIMVSAYYCDDTAIEDDIMADFADKRKMAEGEAKYFIDLYNIVRAPDVKIISMASRDSQKRPAQKDIWFDWAQLRLTELHVRWIELMKSINEQKKDMIADLKKKNVEIIAQKKTYQEELKQLNIEYDQSVKRLDKYIRENQQKIKCPSQPDLQIYQDYRSTKTLHDRVKEYVPKLIKWMDDVEKIIEQIDSSHRPELERMANECAVAQKRCEEIRNSDGKDIEPYPQQHLHDEIDRLLVTDEMRSIEKETLNILDKWGKRNKNKEMKEVCRCGLLIDPLKSEHCGKINRYGLLGSSEQN